MKARELRADYLVLVSSSSDQPTNTLTPSDISAAISRGLHTESAGIDQNLVKRKQQFFEVILPDESSVKAFIKKLG